MVKIRSSLIILISILVSKLAFGQDRLDLFTLSGTYGFPAAYDSVYSGKGTESGFSATLVTPVKLSEKSIWYNGLNYLFWRVDNDEVFPDDVMNPIRIHGIILRTGLIRQLSNGNSLQLLFVPRFMTDFKNVNTRHFQLGGIAIYDKKYSDKLKLGFGALFNQEFFGPNLVPLVNLDWKINEKWRAYGMFPVYGKLSYRVNERLDVGWSHFGLLTTYRLGDPAYEGDYIDRRSIDETLYARYQIFGDIFLEGRFGYAFGRSYLQYDKDQKVDFTLPLISIGDNRIPKTASIHSGIIASLRIVYSIAL